MQSLTQFIAQNMVSHITDRARSFSLSAIILGICSGIAFASCSSPAQTTQNKDKPTTTEKMEPDTLHTMSGLNYIVYEKGDPQQPVTAGMKVRVDYAGYLESGLLFDTSIDSIGALHNFDRGGYPFEPIEFVVGKGQVIRGWDEGLTTDMYVGGRRRLIIPPQLGYGAAGAGPDIPPNATLIFDVHVLEAK